MKNGNGRRWLLGIVAAALFGGLGFSVSQALGAKAGVSAMRERTATLAAEVAGLRRELDRDRIRRTKADDLAREERAAIRAAVERLQGWR